MHKCVLSASTDYFDTLMTTENAIKVDIDGVVLKTLVDFCYSGQIKITSNNAEDLLRAASRYSFIDIQKWCLPITERLLVKKPLNCLQYYTLAHEYKFDSLEKLSLELACKHFPQLKGAEEFLSLDVGPLINLLKSDDLYCPDEIIVLKTVLAWIRRDIANRQKHMPELLQTIRFTQMDIKVIYIKASSYCKLLSIN